MFVFLYNTDPFGFSIVRSAYTQHTHTRTQDTQQTQHSTTTQHATHTPAAADTYEVVFNSSSPAAGLAFNNLVFEDQYIELSTQMEDEPYVYGLGERMDNFRLTVNKTYTIWNADQVRLCTHARNTQTQTFTHT